MSCQNKLFKLKTPYDLEASNELFLKAMQENCAYQYANCPEYRKILDDKMFHPGDLKAYEDIEKLPFLPTLYFKQHAIFSMPNRKMLIKATSSVSISAVCTVDFAWFLQWVSIISYCLLNLLTF